MPKFRMRYKPPVEGQKIPVSETTYQNLKTVSFANSCTIGQWCESHLVTHLRLQTNYQMPASRPIPAIMSKTPRHFEISPSLYVGIEFYA